MRSLVVLVILAVMAGSAAAYGATPQDTGAASGQSSCVIKGNINGSGEHIYHMPGQAYYDRTVVTPDKGERWFCSEAEARAAGWRKSKV